MTAVRLTVSTATDDALDALQDALDEIEGKHTEKTYDHEEGGVQETGYCTGCGRPFPCPTVQIISRQRSKMEEAMNGRGTDRP